MRRFVIYILSLLMALAAVSCTDLYDDSWTSGHDDSIVLHFNASGVSVKGIVEDNVCESYMSHLDVIIYEYEDSEYSPFHYERINVSETPQGSVSLHKTRNDFKENVEYKIFVVANSRLEESRYLTSGTLIDYESFLELDQTDKLIHLSGVDFEIMNPHYPQMFLMDGVARLKGSEPDHSGRIIVNDTSASSDDVILEVVLRRAAAKVVITIIPGANVTFTKELMAQSHGYLIRNMPYRSTLVAKDKSDKDNYPVTSSDLGDYWESTTISQSPYFQLIPIVDIHGNTVNHNVQLTAYCYSHTWEKGEVFEKGTSVVMMLPMTYKASLESTPVNYINNYYQLSITKNQTIKRNTIYDLRITLNAPGAEDITTPEEVENIKYFTAPWEQVDIPVSGESTVKYLKVNKEKIYMYNTADDNTSLYFSSSSPVSVRLRPNSAYYYDKYNQKISLADPVISASTENGAVSGNISVHSTIPTNNTILYFQLEITNQDGLTEYVEVEQYPLIYITNNLPWYSYRDDYYYRTGEGHGFRSDIENLLTAGDDPTTYRYAGDHIVSIYNIDYVNTDTKEVRYTYTNTTPSSNHGFTSSKFRGDASGSYNYRIMYYYFSYDKSGGSWWGGGGTYSWSMKSSECERHNVRNYHVRMMASSDEYKLAHPELDENGYTAGDLDNAKLVSPSFVIASRLGAMLSSYSGLSDMDNEEKLVVYADHCKHYVEVDDLNDDKKDPVEVYDNWRLPTEAELKIIIQLQGGENEEADAIDYLLNGKYYMSASGPVFNEKYDTGSDNNNVAIRCVRDAY